MWGTSHGDLSTFSLLPEVLNRHNIAPFGWHGIWLLEQLRTYKYYKKAPYFYVIYIAYLA
jgi:hypothetical protein